MEDFSLETYYPDASRADQTSLQYWLDTYYPIPAADVSAPEALAHSLQKWRGLRPAVLQAHDLTATPIPVDASTCALCMHYWNSVTPADHGHDSLDTKSCRQCPLAQVRDGVPCKRRRPDEKVSPWDIWCSLRDPEPMVWWLEAAQAWVTTKE